MKSMPLAPASQKLMITNIDEKLIKILQERKSLVKNDDYVRQSHSFFSRETTGISQVKSSAPNDWIP